MEIHIKKNRTVRVDPKHPQTHPGYRDALRVGKENLSRMTFENEAAKRDYMKRVAANPNNVPGIPDFYPPLKIPPMAVPVGETIPEDVRTRMNITSALYVDGEMYCEVCSSVTTHAFSPNQTFCKKCGTSKPYRRRALAS